MNYNYWRDSYDAASGRYMQPDPIGISGGLSVYGYADQMPLVAVDANGLKPYLSDVPPVRYLPAGSVFCVDGVVKPYFMDDRVPDFFRRCKGIMDCREEHEMIHAADFNRDAPGECKQNWLEKIFGSNPKVVNFPKDVFDGYQYSEFQRTELRAHAAELRCLARKLRDKSYCKGGCDAALIQRVNDIVNVMIPAVMAGTYGAN